MDLINTTAGTPRIVIIGGGFGGIQVAKNLKNKPVEVILLDRHNYHTFQPLLYQVAMGALEGDSVAFPIRRIFAGQKNFTFVMADVQQINADANILNTNIGDIKYDHLVIATGANTNYFGSEELEHYTMPMKNLPEALNLRALVLQNLEKALVTTDPEERQALLTFVVVGGGPTGVELSGALAEMRMHILCKDYPGLCLDDMKVYLAEGKSELLAAMSEGASAKAKHFLVERGVTVINSVHVEHYDGLTLSIDNGTVLKTRNVFWAAGVRGEMPGGLTAPLTRGTRIKTDNISRVEGCQNIYAIGDVAAMITPELPEGLPGVAPVAMQQGKHLAKNLIHIINGQPAIPFKYFDKGTMATVGRNRAVADIGRLHFQGFFAWLMWMFVHLLSLAGFSNKLIVFFSWAINYINKDSDNRLIVRGFNTGKMQVDDTSK
ncbi:NAD(P)/FAD-dependent oxidoreductase [Mucilaginibacter mali]|uniref:NADH:ubiquinone reductase (non-electrogenic) n=1 Tax=Mucilaginibacter mali TaxID=2740462 RepID=A0A7D4TMK9_9SPHI|nr:NAD(P)/FAD-dependent oxidoreductase [Mucilaginibacter mali]QKJ30133.1 NAD(P)/FAD-dependent oxidoreductase [Mucilaginibacter mali]